MKKTKKNKKRNSYILLGLALVYFGVLAYLILTVEKPDTLVVTPDNASVTMDGISKVQITVQILDNRGRPMSGQEISYKYLAGSGKVTVVRSITLNDGTSLAEYSTGYGDKQQTAQILISNETGLSKTMTIDEVPSLVAPGQVIIEADTQSPDILEKGLEVEVSLLDTNGKPMINHNLLFKVDSGSGGFLGFRMMTKATSADGKAAITYQPTAKGNVVITVESEEDRSVTASIEFTVK